MVSPVATDSFGHYELRELLGRGGMGQVFRAYDAATDRIVALKVLPPLMAEDNEFQQRFRREARIAASLNDPHVVPIHSYGEIDGRLYVDMRLIEGRDLEHYMAEHGGRLSPDRAVAVVEQVAAALDSAREVGLIHRDVKPSNILVTTARDFVYLIDFGIARAAADTALTRDGHTMGTVAYMAPERFRGTTDHRADVYALACVLYECLTGQRPFPGDSFEQQINAHLSTPVPRTLDFGTRCAAGPRRGGRAGNGQGSRSALSDRDRARRGRQGGIGQFPLPDRGRPTAIGRPAAISTARCRTATTRRPAASGGAPRAASPAIESTAGAGRRRRVGFRASRSGGLGHYPDDSQR